MISKLTWPARSITLVGVLVFLVNQLLHGVVVVLHSESAYLLCQYDCNWYANIVESGYMLEPIGHSRGDAANWAFFPLFPLLGGVTQWVTGFGAHASIVLTAKFLWLPAIWAFLTFQWRYAPQIPLWIGGILVALNPVSIYANTGYTETLFLLLTCLALIGIRSDRPLLAGAMGALLTATRAVGIGIGLTFAVYALRKIFTEPDANGGKLVFAGLMIPLGVVGYMVFLHHHVGDALAFSHIQRAWDRQIGNPVTVLINVMEGGNYNRLMAFFAMFSLAMAIYLAAQKELGLALFLAFVTLIPLSTGVPSMGRYVMFQPPLLLALGLLISSHKWLYSLLVIFILGYLVMTYAWLEGLYFVI